MSTDSFQPTDTGILAGLATTRANRHVPLHAQPVQRRRERLSLERATYVPDLGPRYEVLERLQSSAPGPDFKVIDIANETLVTVKVLPYFKMNAALEARVMRDLKAMTTLRHPNIREVYDYGKTPEGALFIVMEPREGEDLATILSSEQKLSPERTESIFIQLLDALSLAHRNNIVHRDIKPRNVFIVPVEGGHDLVKLCDFGLSRTIREILQSESGETDDSDIYISPEQLRGDVFDPRCDIYSLGCMMYELLSGRPPFSTRDEHLTRTPAPLNQKKSARVPARLEATILRCLEKNMLDRFKTADSVHYDLSSKVVNKRTPRNVPPISWSIAIKALIGLSTVMLPFFASVFFSYPLWLCLTIYGGIVGLALLGMAYNQDLSYRLRIKPEADEQSLEKSNVRSSKFQISD